MCWLFVVLEQEIIVGILLHMQFAHAVIEHLLESVYIGTLTCRDEEAVVTQSGHPSTDKFVDGDIAPGGRSEVVSILLFPRIGIHLLKMTIEGFSAQPRSASVFSTTPICSSKSG